MGDVYDVVELVLAGRNMAHNTHYDEVMARTHSKAVWGIVNG